MHRAFLSLYFLIVASVVLMGLGFDALLRLYAPDNALSESDRDLLQVLEARITAGDANATFAQPLNERLAVYPLSDFAASRMEQRLRSGEVVVVNSSKGERQLYKTLPGSQNVLVLTQPVRESRGSTLYTLLIIVFYLAIAVVIFLWVWPLSRDLRKLESQIHVLGQDHLQPPLQIGQASPVYGLAQAFNRMSQRIRELLASHREMTYAVSHELRTPLARMKFALEMAQSARDPARLRQQLDGVKDDVSEMDTLVNQLLAYAGFEQTSQSLEQQSGDMAALIETLVNRQSAACASMALACPSFIFEVDDETRHVTCEWHLLERALQNLLQNAARFARTQVRIGLKVDEKTARVWVEDDGPGVAEKDRERVFQSFVRISNHTNAKSRGFGLGLAIVKRVAVWHNGNVSVSRADLGGARFDLWWPQG